MNFRYQYFFKKFKTTQTSEFFLFIRFIICKANVNLKLTLGIYIKMFKRFSLPSEFQLEKNHTVQSPTFVKKVCIVILILGGFWLLDLHNLLYQLIDIDICSCLENVIRIGDADIPVDVVNHAKKLFTRYTDFYRLNWESLKVVKGLNFDHDLDKIPDLDPKVREAALKASLYNREFIEYLELNHIELDDFITYLKSLKWNLW